MEVDINLKNSFVMLILVFSTSEVFEVGICKFSIENLVNNGWNTLETKSIMFDFKLVTAKLIIYIFNLRIMKENIQLK